MLTGVVVALGGTAEWNFRIALTVNAAELLVTEPAEFVMTTEYVPAFVVTRRVTGSMPVTLSFRKRTPGFEKCRYGALVAKDDGAVLAVGFRKLWPVAHGDA